MNKLILLSLVLAGCSASLPPSELVAARGSYGATTASRVAELDPGALLTARDALDRAERSFARHGDTPTTRTLSYVAARKAEIAQSAARIALEQRAIRDANQEVAHIDADRLRTGAREPRDTGEALAYTAGALQRERAAVQETEKSVSDVVDDLHKVVHVRRDSSAGFVATIPAPKLFGGDAVALAGPSPELDAVADAIVRAWPGAMVTIESHADSTLGETHDTFVAQRRANAVAAYLAAHGVTRDHVRAVGLAPRHVLAEAAGLERRIEIIVAPAVTSER